MIDNLIIDFGSLGVNLASLFLRITVGGILILHGVRKTEKKFEGTIKWFNSLGFPFNISAGRLPAVMAAFNEIIFGFLLFIGLFTQVAAFVVFTQMLVALYVASVKEQSAFISMAGNTGVYGYELDLHYILGALALLFLGGGIFSIDNFFPIISEAVLTL